MIEEQDTKITVVRDADTGELLMKAATSPDVQIDTTDLIEQVANARTGPDDPDDPGATVSVTSTIAGPAAAAKAAGFLSDAEIEYRKSAVGLGGTGPTEEKRRIFDAGCLKVTAGGEAYWRGCFERRNVPDDDANHWYTLENSWAHGHHDGRVGGLDYAYVANRYFKSEASVEIINQRPKVDLDGGNGCHNVTLQMAPEGVGISDTVRVCPDRIKLGGDSDSVYATWDGWVTHDDDWVASAAMSYAQYKSGTDGVYTFTIKVDEDEHPLG
jgi:hypothetical protein